MPPTTRQQTAREAVTTSIAVPDANLTEQQQQNNVRLRQASNNQFGLASDDAASYTSSRRSNSPKKPPRFIIDLSLPPEQRYLEVCDAFKGEISNLTFLFDEVVGGMVHFISTKWLHFVCKIFLRRVHNNEEHAELQGISKATGVEMYLLVCFNVLLDLFMGCSSGGAVVRTGQDMNSGSKMIHFRTLDWGMPALRRISVQLDYVVQENAPVIASSITYAGYVGVLTGVRKDFSMSLNFRPNRINNGKFWADMKYRWHHLMVLLGRRPSISSILRQFLLPHLEWKRPISWLPFTKAGDMVSLTYSDAVKLMSGSEGKKSMPITTTACYPCFCDGKETTTIEKDLSSSTMRSSTEFIIVTNSDESSPASIEDSSEQKQGSPPSQDVSLQDIIEEAKDRQQCACNNWVNMRVAKAKRLGLHLLSSDGDELRTLTTTDEVIDMVQKYVEVGSGDP